MSEASSPRESDRVRCAVGRLDSSSSSHYPSASPFPADLSLGEGATEFKSDSGPQLPKTGGAGPSIQIGESVGSVIKKRRKKMRKHKQRKLLKRQRHKK